MVLGALLNLPLCETTISSKGIYKPPVSVDGLIFTRLSFIQI